MDQEAINDNVITILETIKQEKVQRLLQANEYERRLEALNGEAGRLREMQQQYVPREVFDRTMEEMRKELKTNADYKTAQEGKTQLTQYIPWIIALAALLWGIFKK